MSTHAETIEAQRMAYEDAEGYRARMGPVYPLPITPDALAALLRERDEQSARVEAAMLCIRSIEQQRDQWREVAEALAEALTLVGKHVSAVTPEINTGKVIDAAIARFDRLKAQEAGK